MYCDICCRYYASLSSLNLHYKRTHLQSRKEDILTTYKENDEFYKPNKKNAFFTQNIDVFTKFENNLPLELKYNQHKCLVCNYTCDNLNQFMEHESSHYKTNENIDYCTTSTNSTNSNNEKNTNAYSPSRRGRGRGRGRGRKIIKVNQQQYKLYDCAPSTSNDISINVCYKKITCAICKEQFTNGQELEIHANKKHMNLYIKLDTNEVETQINNNRNNIETPAEDPIKMLSSNIPNVIAPFQCVLCKTMCTLPEHFEVYEWLN